MQTRDDYDLALQVVGSVIRAWDPYCLLAEGAPDDEFDDQIAKIATYIPHIASPFDAAKAISVVFSAGFGADSFSPEDCADPGTKLFAKLSAAGLVPKF